MAINLMTEIRPGKHRDTFLEQQMTKIQDRLNLLGLPMVNEEPLPVVGATYTTYTLLNVPIAGSVVMFAAGLLIDPSLFTVAGAVITILSVDTAAPAFFQYRY